MTRALLIIGPTASGKSALALRLAAALDGEIVNADSMQAYADLRVLSARPTQEDEAATPHHLYGTIDAARRFSVGAWLEAAVPIIQAIGARGRVPIVVGGTGLYFAALTRGLAAEPDISREIWEGVVESMAYLGPERMHAKLALLDPQAAARLGPADRQRIARAHMLHHARKSPAWRLAQARPRLTPGAWTGMALLAEREAVYAAINARLDAMLAEGALEEVARLAARGLDPSLPCMRAHGVPRLLDHLSGKATLSEAADLTRLDTRHYAKRQYTWIKNQIPAWPRIALPDLAARTAHAIAIWRAGAQ